MLLASWMPSTKLGKQKNKNTSEQIWSYFSKHVKSWIKRDFLGVWLIINYSVWICLLFFKKWCHMMLPQIHPETHASCNLVLNEKDSSCPLLLKHWSIFHRSLFPSCPAATIVLLARIALHLRGEGQRWQDMFLMDFECFILYSGMEYSYDKKWHDFTTSPPKINVWNPKRRRWMEDDCPFQAGEFQVPCQFFRVYYIIVCFGMM